MCHPGRPGPQGDAHCGSPSLAEVARIFLAVLVALHTLTAAHLIEVDSRQLAVVLVGGDAEKDGVIGPVGVAFLQ